MYKLLMEFTVEGQPPSKSNRRQIIPRRGKTPPRLIKSKEARDYMKMFKEVIPEEYFDKEFGALDDDLRFDVIIWYASRRPDLSIELIKDALEDVGVIKNDRYIREEHTQGFVDKENPRITYRLYRITHERVPEFMDLTMIE